MNITLFTVLLATGALFYLTAAHSQDKRFLIPGSGMFILLASFLLLSGSLTYPTGTETVIQNKTVDTTWQNETTVYTDMNTQYQTPQQPTTYIALILLMIAFYGFAVGAFNTKGYLIRGRD